MKKYSFLIIVLLFANKTFAQTYLKEITKHREAYKNEFLEDKHSPLKKADLSYLRFYEANVGYVVNSIFTKVNDTLGFDMQTHNGVIKKYFVYGFVTFTLLKQAHKLYIYQSESLSKTEGLEDYLFIPFTDVTNGSETFGGGRYLDFRVKDIFNNKLILDFNKCYNPYCAYKEGYSCPIPPSENNLKISIKAGEKSFAKAIE